MASHLPLPSKIENAPELELGLGIFLGAFYDLDSCRASGWEEGPIPWTAVSEWCDRAEADTDLRDAMHHHIRALDLEYLRYKASKRPKAGG